jgi:hypothetical protein
MRNVRNRPEKCLEAAAVAEELFDHDENEHENGPRSSLSGELGSPSITWLSWLTATTDSGAPALDEYSGDHSETPGREPLSGWYQAPGTMATSGREASWDTSDSDVEIDEHPTTPLEPLDPFTAFPPLHREGPTLMPPESSLFEPRYGQEPWQLPELPELPASETSVPPAPGPVRPIHLVQPDFLPSQNQQGIDSPWAK